jgi:uncharacterized protein YaaR (DUF327 family)
VAEVEAPAAAVSGAETGGAVSDVDTSAPVSEDSAAAASSEDTNGTHETEAPSFPSADDFGWDAWDGKSDALPEQMRPWGEKFASHYENHFKSQYSAEKAETERLKSIYEALMEGQEDPRNAELTANLEKLQAKFDELNQSSLTTANEFHTYKQVIEQALEDEAQQYAAWYEKQYPQIFNNPEAAQKFTSLLESGWELDYAPTVMELNDEALAIAQKALTEGVPMHYAIELARKTAPPPVRHSPRPGARITSGATGSPVTPNQAPKDAYNEAQSLDDIRLIAAQRAYSKSGRS